MHAVCAAPSTSAISHPSTWVSCSVIVAFNSIRQSFPSANKSGAGSTEAGEGKQAAMQTQFRFMHSKKSVHHLLTCRKRSACQNWGAAHAGEVCPINSATAVHQTAGVEGEGAGFGGCWVGRGGAWGGGRGTEQLGSGLKSGCRRQEKQRRGLKDGSRLESRGCWEQRTWLLEASSQELLDDARLRSLLDDTSRKSAA